MSRGFGPTEVGGDEYATDVRDDEADAREVGVTGVPCVVLDRRDGISGARSPDVRRGAREQAWKDGTP